MINRDPVLAPQTLTQTYLWLLVTQYVQSGDSWKINHYIRSGNAIVQISTGLEFCELIVIEYFLSNVQIYNKIKHSVIQILNASK